MSLENVSLAGITTILSKSFMFWNNVMPDKCRDRTNNYPLGDGCHVFLT